MVDTMDATDTTVLLLIRYRCGNCKKYASVSAIDKNTTFECSGEFPAFFFECPMCKKTQCVKLHEAYPVYGEWG